MENPKNLVLYQSEACPFCQLVRKKLNLLNLPVLLMPVEAKGSDRKALIELSGQQQVPVLANGDEVVVDSERILEYLDEQFGKGKTGPMPANDFGLGITMAGPYDQVVAKTIDALKTQGFGVLTEIDIKTTLKKKIDVDIPHHIILGACNPEFAHQATTMEPDISLLLPCNVTVRETRDNQFAVTAVNPIKLLSMVGREDLLPIATEVKDKLKSALSSLNG